jgi:hypothetical protein
VEYLNPSRPNEALVESVKNKGTKYIVRDIYSKFPSCSCQYSFEGNFCKHQVKALIDRDHKAGLIVSGIGTYLGSQYAGVAEPKVEPSTPPMEVYSPLLHTPDHSGTTIEYISEDSPEVSSVESEEYKPNSSSPDPIGPSTPHTLDNLIHVFKELVSGNDQLMQTALHTVMRGISDLSLMKQTQLESGKDFIEPLDSFIIPRGLTKKRQLGAIDYYHGGSKGKRSHVPTPRKNRKSLNAPTPDSTEVSSLQHKDRCTILTSIACKGMLLYMHFLIVCPCGLPQVKEAEVTMDRFPMTAGQNREHYRATLNRRAQEAILGKRISISEFRAHPELYIPCISTTRTNTGLQIDADLELEIDLNTLSNQSDL